MPEHASAQTRIKGAVKDMNAINLKVALTALYAVLISLVAVFSCY